MYTASGRVEDRSPRRLPDCPPNREHPKDGCLNHRNGRIRTKAERARGEVVAVEGGTMPTRTNEYIKKVRGGMMGSRSKLAVASSSAKAQVFVRTQVQADRNIDCPIETHFVNVRSQRGMGVGKGLARGIRRA